MSKIWRCPECETINQGAKCVVCGYVYHDVQDAVYSDSDTEQDGQTVQPDYNRQINDNVVQDALKHKYEQSSLKDNDLSQYEYDAVKKPKKFPKILAAVSLCAGAFVFGFALNYFLNSDSPEKNAIPVITETSSGAVTQSQKNDITTSFSENKKTVDEVALADETIEAESQNEMVTVPNLIGLSKSDAISKIQSGGLSYEVRSAESDNVEKDYVISQNVPADVEVPINKCKIILTVSEGKKMAVPYLIYMDINEVKSTLDSAGISYAIKYEDDNRVDKDHVFKQSLKSGTKIDENTQLFVYVSNHNNTTTVPNVLNMSYGDAVNALNNANLTYKIVYSDDTGAPNGYVFRQSIGAGNNVKENTQITITVSTHTDVITISQEVQPERETVPAVVEITIMPFVVGKSLSEAVDELDEAKIDYIVIDEDDGKTPKGVIIRQSINPGTSVEVYSSVKIYVSTHEENEIQVVEVKPEEINPDNPDYPTTLTLPVKATFDLKNAVMPIEGTAWNDYTWESSNTAKLQFVPRSSTFSTYSVGTITVTATLKSDTSRKFQTKIKIVREDEYYGTTTVTADDSWFYNMMSETEYTYYQ